MSGSWARRSSLSRNDACVAPIYIGPANAEHVLGQPWRWVRDAARRLGVPVLRVGGKSLIRASELIPALEREATSTEHDGAVSVADARSELARRLRIGSGA